MSETPAGGELIKVDITPEQQDEICRKTGITLRTWKIERRHLAALALLAQTTGTDVLCYGPSLVDQLLHPRGEPGHDTSIEILLTPAQKEQIRDAIGMSFSAVRMAADDLHVSFSESWEGKNEPVRIGRTFVILPDGQSLEGTGAERVIRITSGREAAEGVFGTGRHPTTRLSLGLLEDHLKNGSRVLDLGTGSGVLAVAAARLGAREVLALDVDEQAVACARETVRANEMSGVIRVERGDRPPFGARFELVVANLFTNVLLQLAPELSGAMQPSGLLIASGVIGNRASDVVKAMRGNGLRFKEQRSEDDWHGLVFERP
jgi:ribosomal protein L11 methyltransferase